MTVGLRKVGLVAGLTASGFTRDRGFWTAVIVACLAAGLGGWWRDINFGSEPGRFVFTFGLSVQSLGVIILAIVMIGQLKARQTSTGHAEVLWARGVLPSIVVAGEVLGLVVLLAVFVGGSAIVLGIVLVAGGNSPNGGELVIASGMQWVKGAVVVALGRWCSAFGRSLFFVMVATALFSVVGHLKTWTETLGGLGWWFTRPIPNLSWLGQSGYSSGHFDVVAALGTLGYAAGYIMIFLFLAAKAEGRRE
ncbi:hypothetical protein N9023_00050 [Opitutaceae bacterium]|nr:hypothetical protein [Opitutaceae bacterium]